MKELQNPSSGGVTPPHTLRPKNSTNSIEEGFAKIIAGGRIVRPDPNKPELVRMVTGDSKMAPYEPTLQKMESLPGNLIYPEKESIFLRASSPISIPHDRRNKAIKEVAQFPGITRSTPRTSGPYCRQKNPPEHPRREA